MVETLLGKGYSIRVYDKNVSVARLVGANKRAMDEHVPHLSSVLVDTPSSSSITPRSWYRPRVAGNPGHPGQDAADQFVIDLVPGAEDMAMAPKYEGICW